MLNIIGIAFAQTTGAEGASASPLGAFGSMLPIALMIVIFYFLLIRPQQKKEKDKKKMVSEVREGDRVLTVGGIYGTVASVKDENTIILKIANNTKIELARSSIQSKVS